MVQPISVTDYWLVVDDQPSGARRYLVTGADGRCIGAALTPAGAAIFQTKQGAKRAIGTVPGGGDDLWFVVVAAHDPAWVAAVVARGVDALRQDQAAYWSPAAGVDEFLAPARRALAGSVEPDPRD